MQKAAPVVGTRRRLRLTSDSENRGWQRGLPTPVVAVLLLPIAAAFGLLVLYPLTLLVRTSFEGGLDGYVEALSDPVRLNALWTTLWESALITALTVGAGYMIAWSLRTSNSRVRLAILWLAVLVPMWMSVVVKNYAWIILLGRYGAINSILTALHLPAQQFLFTPLAVVIGMVHTLFPFAVLPLYITLRSIPDEFLSAAASLGARSWRVQSSIVMPLALPGIFVTAILVFVLAIGFYVTPLVLGGTNSTFLSVVIQNDIFLRFDPYTAAATSVAMIAIALILVLSAMLVVGRSRFERVLG